MERALKDNALVEITIKKWVDYNPRRDAKRPSWFRFEHSFFTDSQFFDFTPHERLIWLYFLCEASRRNNRGKFVLNNAHLMSILDVQNRVIECAIEKLKRNQIIECDSHGTRTVTLRDSPATYERTNVTNVTNEKTFAQSGDCATHLGLVLDMEAVYALYPRKLGKKRGLEKARRQIRSQEQLDRFRKAVENYTLLVAGREAEFIKHFDSFVSVWEDYVDLPQQELPLEARKKIIGDQISREEAQMREQLGYA